MNAGRTPPNDELAELGLLSYVLSAGQVPPEVNGLEAADFYRPENEILWVVIRELAERGDGCGPVAVRNRLRERDQLGRGGVSEEHLVKLTTANVTIDPGHVAGLIQGLAARRRLAAEAERFLQRAYDPGADVQGVVADHLERVTRIPARSGPSRRLKGGRTAEWLRGQIFDPLQWVVPGIIPEGYSLLVGAPKIGKSWLALAIALAVSAGGYMFGKLYCGRPRPVLLLALEDSDRRMQSRILTLQPADASWPAGLTYYTRVRPDDVVPLIEDWLTQQATDSHPVVILDTIGKVMPPPERGEGQYLRDYRFSGQLQAITAARPGMALIGLHHDRKATAEDFVETISGTNGIAGAADTILVLNRPRNESEGLLKITGRDVEENEYGVKLTEGRWTLMGDNLKEAARAARTVRQRVPMPAAANLAAVTANQALAQALLNVITQGRRPRCSDPALPDYWLSEHSDDRRQAAAWCHGCPVLTECAEAGRAGKVRVGVWAGKDHTPRAHKPRPPKRRNT
jgi:hypothetical protein